MRKRVQVALTLLLVAIVGAVLWEELRGREPSYQGKSLSRWLWAPWEPGSQTSQDMRRAVQHMGTNAIPRLLELAAATDSAFKVNLSRTLQRLTPVSYPPAELFHLMAAQGFDALGPAAKPAVPALIGLLNHGNLGVRSAAAHCLAAIGPEAQAAVPALTKCLKDVIANGSGSRESQLLTEYAADALGAMGPRAQEAIPFLRLATNAPLWFARNAASAALMRLSGQSAVPLLDGLKDTSDPIKWYERAMLISEFGTNAELAVPLLIAALTNSNDIVVGHAAIALGRIKRHPDACVPALIPLLHSPSVSTRQKSLTALGEFGSAATSAAPAMTACLADPDPWVRMQAPKVLRAINREAAPQAGVK